MNQDSLFAASAPQPPLADRLRPQSLDDVAGQQHLLAPGKPLRAAIEAGRVPSCIFWGPPGTGKTTLALIIAKHTDQHFEPFSAVTEGVGRVREIIAHAEARRRGEGRGTILFCDEIHRFNKGQQDAFLPWVERGVITLIGATTENPSFELNGALLSRCQVYVLHPLSPDDLRRICASCVVRSALNVEVEPAAIDAVVQWADGDARRAINAMEALLSLPRTTHHALRTLLDVESVLSRRIPKYDKAGEEHFNLISALHKSVRASDPDAALYWLARMLEGGESPLYLARRLVRMAVEDIGLADPQALSIALAGRDVYHFLGSPEGDSALAQVAIYLAQAPKSRAVDDAFNAAREAAQQSPAAPVPMHIRNAPTGLMKELGYGKGAGKNLPDGVLGGWWRKDE